jgi:hypothetical protein
LGRYTEDPDKFKIEFQTLALGFYLTWRDVQFLLAGCYSPTEREKILTTAHKEANAREPIG